MKPSPLKKCNNINDIIEENNKVIQTSSKFDYIYCNFLKSPIVIEKIQYMPTNTLKYIENIIYNRQVYGFYNNGLHLYLFDKKILKKIQFIIAIRNQEMELINKLYSNLL